MSSSTISVVASALLWVASVLVANPALALVQSTLLLRPGSVLGGQQVDIDSPWISVQPGEQISGVVNVQSTIDPFYSYAVAPLGYTATWGDRTTQSVLSFGWISTGVNDYAIQIDKVAPTDPGTYYIPIAFSYEFTIEQVMSATVRTEPNQPVWNDGNDLGWDWSSSQFQQAAQLGYETQLLRGWILQDSTGFDGTHSTVNQPATWIGVRVVSVPEPASYWLLLSGLGLLVWRRRFCRSRLTAGCA